MNSLQKKISQNIKQFDICALLKLLQEMGYQNQDIAYRSNADFSSRSSLCEDIVFSETHPKVLIILNLGLLSGSSPLPDFFRKKMDCGSIDPVLFTKYISFFDHHIIKNLMLMSMPDLNSVFFPSWKTTEYHYLKLLDLNSTSTLWHLFQVTFTELSVKLVKAPRRFRQNSSSVVLGTSRLGIDSYLGKEIIETTPSFKCILTGEETVTDLGVPWPLEIKSRLKNKIFSILQRTYIHFKIIFVLKNHKETARLTKEVQLGFCMLGKSDKPLNISLFSGYAQEIH